MAGRRADKPTPIDLDELITTFGGAVGFWETQPEAEVLARARLADACRDAGIRPLAAETFQSGWNTFDQEHQRRFCLLISGLDVDGVAKRLPVHSRDRDGADAVLLLFQQLTTRLPLLTLDVLQQSDVRLEEFARHFCVDWGLKITGERPVNSEARLHDIDFGRLMKEAEAARSSAEDRLAYLRELQEKEEETRRPRRGKW